MPQVYETILVDVSDEIATIVLNRPDRANSFVPEMMADLISVSDWIAKEDNVRVALITGAGRRHFSAGADLKVLTEFVARGEPFEFPPGGFFMDIIAAIPKPTVAVINGKAVGGGCELALACDFRFMASDTVIGVPEVRFGEVPGAGGTQRLPRIVGYAKALEMMLTGRLLAAEEALAIGLVTAVAPRQEVVARARAFAKDIAQRPPYAVQTAKYLASMAFDLPIAEGCALERRMSRTMATPEERAAAKTAVAEQSSTYQRLFSSSDT